MHTTSITLLERLRLPGEEEAWSRFVDLYTPLIYQWALRAGLEGADAADLVQDVFVQLVQKLPDFLYDPGRSFRGWLRTVTLNKWRDRCRRRTLTQQENASVEDLAGPENVRDFWESEYRQHLVGRALELMKREFQPTTWQACWECVVADKTPAEVAVQLNMTAAAVYAAKSRVLRRLREELNGLMD